MALGRDFYSRNKATVSGAQHGHQHIIAPTRQRTVVIKNKPQRYSAGAREW